MIAPGVARMQSLEPVARNGSVVRDILAMPAPEDVEELAQGMDRADLADKDLDTLANEARWHREQAELHHERMLYHSVESGRRLLEVKARLKYGEFSQYIVDEVGISRMHAHRLMALAKPEVVTRVLQLPPDTSIRSALETIKEENKEERKANRLARPVPVIDLPPFIPCNIEVGDCIDLPLPDGLVDLTVTSPPYGLGVDYADTDDDEGYTVYMQHVFAWAVELFRVTKDGGRLCLNVPLDVTYGGTKPIYADWVRALSEAGWQYRTTIVWDEDNVSKSTARGSVDSPSSPHVFARVEVIVVMFKGEWNLRRNADHDLSHEDWLSWTNGMWKFPGVHSQDHPAPFPETLPTRCITMFSFRDSVVLDPFVGSGTTAVAAYRLGRTFYGFDHSPRYVELAKARVVGEMAA